MPRVFVGPAPSVAYVTMVTMGLKNYHWNNRSDQACRPLLSLRNAAPCFFPVRF
jgi:hypothetical protein